MYKKVAHYSFTQVTGHTPDSLFSWFDNDQLRLASYFKDELQIMSLTKSDEDNVPYRLIENRSTKLSDSRCNIFYARVIQAFSQHILILITERDIQFHHLKTNQVLYTFLADEHVERASTPQQTFSLASGIALFRIPQDDRQYIAMGYELCGLLVFSVDKRFPSNVLRVTFERLVLCSPVDVAITQVDSQKEVHGCHLASGDTGGNIVLWLPEPSRFLKKKCAFESFNTFPVTSLALTQSYVIASYGSGHIRVYSLESDTLISHVRGHSAWINCMKVLTTSEGDVIVLSASDDSRVRFWKISKQVPLLKHFQDYVIKNTLLVGLAFADPYSLGVFVVGYDSALVTFLDQQ